MQFVLSNTPTNTLNIVFDFVFLQRSDSEDLASERLSGWWALLTQTHDVTLKRSIICTTEEAQLSLLAVLFLKSLLLFLPSGVCVCWMCFCLNIYSILCVLLFLTEKKAVQHTSESALLLSTASSSHTNLGHMIIAGWCKNQSWALVL